MMNMMMIMMMTSGWRPGQEAAADGGAGHQVRGEARHQVM